MKQQKVLPMTNNTDKSRFEFELEAGKLGIVKYEQHGQIMKITHTQIPREIRGNGYGTQMVKETLEELRDNQFKVIPLCPFVSSFIEERPEWESIVYHPSEV